MLHGAPTGTIQKLQRVQSNAARIVFQAPRRSHVKPLWHQLHIGCQTSSGSRTSWQFWRTKFGARPLRFTCSTESRNVSAAELYIHLPSYAAGTTVHKDRLFQSCFPIFNTVCLELAATKSSDQRSLFLNLDLKLFSSFRLSLNTDPTCP